MTRKDFPTLFKFASSGAVQRWDICAIGEDGGAFIEVSHGQDGGAIQTTTTRVQGKNIGKRNETSPFEQACLEAESKWKKQIDKGYALTPTERAATAPMLAHPYEDNKSRVTFPCYFQPKLDGVRAVAEKQGGKVTLWSRLGKEYTAVPHVNKVLEDIMTDGQILDGELYAHKVPFQTLISWVKKNQPDSKRIQYNVYDMVSPKPFKDRFADFCAIVGKNGQGVVRTVHTAILWKADDIETKLIEAIERGYEGIMIRTGDCTYQSGQRSRELLKVKEFKDEEFEIIGAEEGQGKCEGQATFICKTKQGAIFKCRSRGEDSLREHYWKERDKYVGKMLTVRFFEWTTGANPVPRFPVGIAVRDYE
jgi:DNA ligase-1